jgi:hypothetical protein
MESSDQTNIDDVDRRGVDGGEDVVVDADNSADRSAETEVDAVDPAADDDGILAVLETSGSGN